MADDGAWFRPKRYGFGATPVTWQGWALVLAFVAMACAVVIGFGGRPWVVAAILVPLLVSFITITIHKTRGGWRWRWGDEK